MEIRKKKSFVFQEKAFQLSLPSASTVLLAILVGIFITLLLASLPTIKSLGFKFLYSSEWDPVSDDYGSFPFLVGTLLTSLMALLMAIPFSIAIGLFLGEYYVSGKISAVIKNIIELLAGIPSVIFGFWGLFILVPLVRKLELAWGYAPYGVGLLSASFVLAIMIMPYAVSLTRQVITMVPSNLKEAAYSLGATRYEVVRKIILPYTRSGIFAGILLALGRALGETMAVTMLIGNLHAIPKNIFAPANTMPSIIANEFTEATGALYTSALIEMALLLFLVTTVINIIGRQIIKRFTYNVN